MCSKGSWLLLFGGSELRMQYMEVETADRDIEALVVPKPRLLTWKEQLKARMYVILCSGLLWMVSIVSLYWMLRSIFPLATAIPIEAYFQQYTVSPTIEQVVLTMTQMSFIGVLHSPVVGAPYPALLVLNRNLLTSGENSVEDKKSQFIVDVMFDSGIEAEGEQQTMLNTPASDTDYDVFEFELNAETYR